MDKIPQCQLYGAVIAEPSVAVLKEQLESGKITALPVESAGIEAPELKSLAVGANDAGWNARIISPNYNSLDIEVQSGAPKMLFWRDARFPFWQATVNGQPATIYRAFLAYKAVAVPSGTSLVHFQFCPPLVAGAIVLGRLSLFLVFAVWLASWVSSRACRRMSGLLRIHAA